ncbi:MAG TPA: hypothetical protein VJ001_12190 [Rhodocyclaceae bacterium]|nr:hypothetical protein [Rhodocyclaceae bacterium]
MQAIRYEAKVAEDHVLHVPTPELPAGTLAEVIVLVRQRPRQAHAEITELFGKFPRFATLDAVNAYMDDLREDR